MGDPGFLERFAHGFKTKIRVEPDHIFLGMDHDRLVPVIGHDPAHELSGQALSPAVGAHRQPPEGAPRAPLRIVQFHDPEIGRTAPGVADPEMPGALVTVGIVEIRFRDSLLDVEGLRAEPGNIEELVPCELGPSILIVKKPQHLPKFLYWISL